MYLPAVTLAQDSRKRKVGEGKRKGGVGLGIADFKKRTRGGGS
jgi:hypothetical protein